MRTSHAFSAGDSEQRLLRFAGGEAPAKPEAPKDEPRPSTETSKDGKDAADKAKDAKDTAQKDRDAAQKQLERDIATEMQFAEGNFGGDAVKSAGTNLENAAKLPDPKEKKETPDQRYKRVKQEKLTEREQLKYLEAFKNVDKTTGKPKWGTLNVGKSDGKGKDAQPFQYKAFDLGDGTNKQEKLLAYSPKTGLQVMDPVSGKWEFAKNMKNLTQDQKAKLDAAEQEAAKGFDANLKAEQADPNFAKKEQFNRENHDTEEDCLKKDTADRDWFQKEGRGQEYWKDGTLNDEIRKALEDPNEKGDEGKADEKKPDEKKDDGKKPDDKAGDKKDDKKPEEKKPEEKKPEGVPPAPGKASGSDKPSTDKPANKTDKPTDKGSDKPADKAAAKPAEDAARTENLKKKEALESTIDGLKRDRAAAVKEYGDFLKKGLDHGVKNPEEGQKIDAKIKAIEQKIEQAEKDLAAVNKALEGAEGSEKTIETASKLLDQREELKKEYEGLKPDNAKDRERGAKILKDVKEIEDQLPALRKTLEGQRTTINPDIAADRAKVPLIDAAAARIDAVIKKKPATTETPTPKADEKKTEKQAETREQKIVAGLQRVLEWFKSKGIKIPTQNASQQQPRFLVEDILTMLRNPENREKLGIYINEKGALMAKETRMGMDSLNPDTVINDAFENSVRFNTSIMQELDKMFVPEGLNTDTKKDLQTIALAFRGEKAPQKTATSYETDGGMMPMTSL